MRFPVVGVSHPLACLVVLAALVASCAPATRGPPQPVVSPTGYEYPLGTPPVDTQFSQTAALYLRQENPERALELALEGIEAHPANAIHYFLAGVAHARLGSNEEADVMFVEAERIYPAYELEVEPERERAWAISFNEGIEAFDQGDLDTALDAWGRATRVYNIRPDAHRNLAAIFAGEGRYDDAIEVYQDAIRGLSRESATRVLSEEERSERAALRVGIEEDLAQLFLFSSRFAEAEPLLRAQLDREPDNLDLKGDLAGVLAGLGREAEAAEIYSSLLSEGEIEANALFNIGVSLFQTDDFAGAAEAFERLTRLQPESRDAWFNFANALLAAEEWERLVGIGPRLVELDPLSETAGLIAARSHLELGDEASARVGLEAVEALPVFVSELQLRPSGARTTVMGRVTPNAAEPGALVHLRFHFLSDGAPAGVQDVTVVVPTDSTGETFEVEIEGRAGAYRYEVLPN